MRLETIRKAYNDGLYLREEAIQTIVVIGKSRDWAERYIDGYVEPDASFKEGASHMNVLAFRQ